MYKSCSTDCGDGKEFCLTGSWDGCDAPKSCSTNVLGDVNCDGKVNQSDLDQVSEYWKENITKFTTNDGSECVSGVKNADLNCDGNPGEMNDLIILIGYVKNGNTGVIQCPPDTLMLGDVNCNQKVTMQDRLAVVDYIIGTTTEFKKANGNICTTGKKAADVTCDGTINIADVNAITDYILGSPNFFPGCESRIAMFCGNSISALELYVTNIEGTQWEKYNSLEKSNNLFPNWSPDGKKVVYRAYKDDKSSLYIHDFGSNVSVKIPHQTDKAYFADWSSKNQLIGSFRDNNNSYYMAIGDPQGNNWTKLPNTNNYPLNAVWSSDGKMLAYEKNGWIKIIQNLNNPLNEADAAGGNNCIEPAWTNDDHIVAVCPGAGVFDLFMLPVYDTPIITTSGHKERTPSVSPDGKNIVFDSEGKGIYVMNIPGGIITKLPNQPGAVCTTPSWSK